MKLDWAQLLRMLRELEIRRIGAWPAWLRMAMGAALLAVILAAGHSLALAPRGQELQRLRTDALALRRAQADKRAAAALLEAARQQQQTLQGILAGRLRQLPADGQTPALLEAVTEAAEAQGVSILAISFGVEQGTAGDASQAVGPAAFYTELPMRISLSGGYHQFGAFVSRLASLPRLVILQDFDVRRQRSEPGLTMHLNAKIYRHRENLR